MDAILTPPTILRETLGARLRRLAAAAGSSNPLTRDPLLPPPAWAQGTAYGTGSVVAANGGWYVCAAAGTSAGSGAGPSHVGGAVLADNSVLWSYLGPARIDAADPDAPTLSAATATPGNPNDNAFTPVQHPSLFRLFGGFGEAIVTNYVTPHGFESNAGTRDYGHGGFGVETDAPVVAFRLYTNQPSPRVVIDGRYLSPGGFARSASSTWHSLTFPTRRKRSLLFEGPKDAWIVSSLAIPRSSQLRAMPAAEIRAAFIGDSLFAGSSYGPWTAGNTAPGRIGKWLGWDDVWNLSKGGTGWIATGGGFYTYGERVAQAAALNPDILVFGTPTNDYASPSASVTAAVKAALEAVRANAYRGPIVILGGWPKNDANVAVTEAAVASGIAAAGDPLGLTFFIPLFATSYAPVVCGTWNNAFNPLMDNSALAIAGDGTHPSELGIAILSDFVAQEIRRSVLPAIR